MTPDDAARAARLHAAAFAPVARGWSAREFRDLAESPGVRVWLCDDAVLVGRLGPAEAELLTLAVAPASRREGRARLLLAAFETAAADTAQEAFLEVAVDNAAAIALYRSAGWSEAGRRSGYYRRANARIDALVLRKALRDESSRLT
ncbi:MAG: GNAT family N-acetyltransferase [Pseudomonadota bacterium]